MGSPQPAIVWRGAGYYERRRDDDGREVWLPQGLLDRPGRAWPVWLDGPPPWCERRPAALLAGRQIRERGAGAQGSLLEDRPGVDAEKLAAKAKRSRTFDRVVNRTETNE
jgi:hypothetical protein